MVLGGIVARCAQGDHLRLLVVAAADGSQSSLHPLGGTARAEPSTSQ